MDSLRHRRRGAARLVLVSACCGLTLAVVGQGALADSGQARDMAAGGVSASHPSAMARSAIAASAGAEWSRGMSRAAGALVAVGLGHAPASAVLEKCVTATSQPERYATFVGRMSAVPGSTGMAMRIGIEERAMGEASFHPLEGAGAPVAGAWRSAEPGVRIFKDVKVLSSLEAPVDYRAVVRFRWTDAKGLVVRREVLRTPACHQPAPEGQLGSEDATARMRSR